MPTREAEGSSSKKRVLILHVAAGVGHARAAYAVEAALREMDPSCEPVVRDALEFSSPLMRRFYASTYNQLVDRLPRVWEFFYRQVGRIPAMSRRQRLRSALMAANCRDFVAAVDRFGADMVLCTQFLPAEVYAWLRSRGDVKVPVFCVITDFYVHPIWVYPGIDHYFVAAEASAEELRATGVVSPDRIEITGVPIDPKFATSVGRENARRELGLDPDPRRLTLLLMGGGFGWGPMEAMMDVVLRLPESVQAVFVAGKNESLQEKLTARAAGHEARIKVHGFTDRVHVFLEAADVYVGKAGGLTCSEAMSRGVPVVAVRPIPGQEERNCDFMQEAGAGVRVHDLFDLHVKLSHFLDHPEDLE
ncbi:MAG TPA: glycosyltransferase, partial [Candidatus Polarisedimenticolia bacterium]|nr:glycosyltransferase [Candidatus Polarisedimenticolia bacterium]